MAVLDSLQLERLSDSTLAAWVEAYADSRNWPALAQVQVEVARRAAR